ncbi:hypothetical protein ABIA27_001311 [Sinorhizobium fredii]
MLDWLENPSLRRRCQAGLNKSEQRHALTQAIYTLRQGQVADRSHEAQQYRASGLNLVIAAMSTGIRPIWPTLWRICDQAAKPLLTMGAHRLLRRLSLGSSRKGDRPETAQSVDEAAGCVKAFRLRSPLALSVLLTRCPLPGSAPPSLPRLCKSVASHV